MHLGKLLLTMVALMAPNVGVAYADELDDIVSRGTIRIAIDLGIAPFGFMNENNEPDGIDVVAANALAADLGVELEIVTTNSANRIAQLTSGRADLVMSSLAINAERAKAINFSSPYYVVRTVVLAPGDVDIQSPEDLVGKKVSVARGNTSETDMIAISPPGSELIRFDDEAGAMNALASGQVDAYATSEPQSRSLVVRFPERSYEAKLVLRTNYISVGIARGQYALLQWVNSWVHFHMHNDGKLAEIYKQFLGTDLPDVPSL